MNHDEVEKAAQELAKSADRFKEGARRLAQDGHDGRRRDA